MIKYVIKYIKNRIALDYLREFYDLSPQDTPPLELIEYARFLWDRRCELSPTLKFSRWVEGSINFNLFGWHIYMNGANATRWATNITKPGFGCLTIRPPSIEFAWLKSVYFGWAIWKSPDGTPRNATFLFAQKRGYDSWYLRQGNRVQYAENQDN
jgi:hypothetical protein